MDKIKLIKHVDKLNYRLAIMNLILWLGLFMSIFFIDYDIESLRRVVICSTLAVVVDLIFDIFECRRKRNGTL